MEGCSALTILDMQKDYLPGGPSPVPQADDLVPIINEYIGLFSGYRLPVFGATAG
ncbi:MAG: hypothetical protein GF398_04260 [Chitinivibrionales bacterium]|nr:hypothetical protein [Chitinivibrionales bacterium]